VVTHSRLLPPHGSSPAGWPRRTDTRKFQRNSSTDTPVRKAPTVEARLAEVQRSSW
jgi:hypothetical protein